MEYKVTYQKTNYNLNALLSFDLLKEVLFKLLLSQENIEKEIEKIKTANAKRDKEISKLKDNIGVIDESFSDQDEEGENEESEQQDEHEENKDNTEEQNISQKEDKLEEDKSQKEKKEDTNININETDNDKNIIIQDKNINKEQQLQFDNSNKEVNYSKANDNNNNNINSNDNNNITNDNNKEKNEKDENVQKKNEVSDNKITVDVKKEKENEKNEVSDNKKTVDVKEEKEEDKTNSNFEKENKEDKESVKNEKKTDSKKPKKPKQKKSITDQSENIQIKREVNIQQGGASQIPPDLIRNMAKQIKDNKKKIVDLEKRLKDEMRSTSDTLKKDYQKLIKEHNNGNQADLKAINSKLDELFLFKEDLDTKMEDCISKCSTIDIYNMFKDSGDGTVDAAKVLVRALEEKVFKKFELVDARYKKDAIDNLKTKNNVDSLLPKSEKIEKDIEKINEVFDKRNEEFDNLRKELDEKNEKMKSLIDENNNNLIKNLERIKDDFDNIIKNKLNELEQKIKDLKNNVGDGATELFKLGLGNKGVDEEVIQSIEKKIGDIRRKINDLENTLKLQSQSQEIEQNELNNMKNILDKKITRDDLKELYNLHLAHVDELSDLKDNAGISYDEIRKLKDEVTNIFQKLDSINGNIVLLQNSHSNGGGAPIINFDKYVDNQKFTDTLKPILKEIEKMYREIDSLNRNLSELESMSKSLAKVERVNRLEDEISTKIIEVKTSLQRKFVDKAEFAKNIKQLEIQIKSLDGDNKKSDADSWIMAKKPIGCFNCATCEANIKNENPSNEYLAWNKYPQQDKIYRMGQGFSHMLQMMTSEFIKSIGNAQKENNDNDLTARSLLRHSNNVLLEKNHFSVNDNNERKNSASVLRVNNKEQINDETLKKINAYNLYSSKIKGKIQLPRVFKFQKKLKLKNEDNNIPISDDEYTGRNNSVERDGIKEHISVSPKIMKILKRKPLLKTEENFDYSITNNNQ